MDTTRPAGRCARALLLLGWLASVSAAQDVVRPSRRAARPAEQPRPLLVDPGQRPPRRPAQDPLSSATADGRGLPTSGQPAPGATNLSYSPVRLVVEQGAGPFHAAPRTPTGGLQDFALGGPALPPGLVLDPLSGVVSGNPLAPQPPTMHTITATGPSGSASFDFLVEVLVPEPPRDLQYAGTGSAILTLPQGPIAPLPPAVEGRVDAYSVLPPLPNRTLSVSGGLVLPRTGVLLPENVNPIAYTPPEQTIVHSFEVLNVWLPNGTPPDTGWPVLLSNPNSGYFGAPPFDELDPADPIQLLFHEAINAGFAVVFAGNIDSGPVTGWFAPPGHPSGRWEDPNALMPEKDVLHAIQWVKVQTAYDLDPDRIFLHGVSAGATLAAWVGLGGELASGRSPQTSASSRVAGILCFDTLTSFAAYDGADDVIAHHWESVTSPGSSAARMSDADPAVLDAGSVARVLLDPTCNGATTPVFLAYDDVAGSLDFSNDTDGFPALRGQLGGNVHDLWHGAKLWERLLFLDQAFHQDKSEFFVANGAEGRLGGLAGAETGTFTGSVLDSPELYDAAIDWLVLRSREPIPDPSGLRLHPKSGILHGTPNVKTPRRSYTITATNPGGLTREYVSIRVSNKSGP